MRRSEKKNGGVEHESIQRHEHGSREESLLRSESGQVVECVDAVEHINLAWTSMSLFWAYLGLLLVANVTSLEQQSTSNLVTIATSEWNQLALVSTITITQGIFYSTLKPIMAKISDVAGRLEAFCLCIALYVSGYCLMAFAQGMGTYGSAQIFYAAGATGLQILQQVFVADTTDLLLRATFSSLPDLPYLWTTWAGPQIFGAVVKTGGIGWRWGYGIWIIVLPVAFLPLFLALLLDRRKAKDLGLNCISPYKFMSATKVMESLWFELDLCGLMLFTSSIALILLPLTLGSIYGWDMVSYIPMFAMGGLCLLALAFWERSPRFAPQAFFPREVFCNRTVIFGYLIAFSYFAAFYLSVLPYFYTYLSIVQNLDPVTASYITQVFSFGSSLTSVFTGILIWYAARYKYFVIIGAGAYVVGIGMMIVYRHEGASVTTLVCCQIVLAIGGGMLNVPAQLGVQASVGHEHVAAATAVFLAVIEVGGAVGAAISGAIWSSFVPAKLKQYLPAATKGQAATIFGNIHIATSYPLGSPVRVAINRSYQETMDVLLIVAICFATLLVPLSFGMENHSLDKAGCPLLTRSSTMADMTDRLADKSRGEVDQSALLLPPLYSNKVVV